MLKQSAACALLALSFTAPTRAESQKNPLPASSQAHTPKDADAAQTPNDQAGSKSLSASPYRRHWIGSSLFMLANLVPSEEPPSFFQLNYGYRLTPKDTVSVEAITWKYYAPLGIPYGPKMSEDGNEFPGSVRGYGLGLAYQRFIWKGLYAAVHALPLRQIYLDEDNDKIQSGFQLFVTGRVGYHVAFLKNRIFLEPSIAMTAWPINTHLPGSFREQESKWHSFFVAEPGLHYGVKF